MQLTGYRESRLRGEPGFPIELYHCDRWHPRYQMGYHWHVEYEIIRVLQGALVLELDGEKKTGLAGDVFFVNSGVLHAGTPGKGCVYECIVFDPSLLDRKGSPCQKILGEFKHGNWLVDAYFPPACTQLRQAADALFACMGRAGEEQKLLITGYLFQLFGFIAEGGLYTKHPQENRGARKKIRQLKAVLELIDLSYNTPLTLEEMSAAAGMAPKYFCQFFHNMTGRTPIDYLNFHRVEIACLHISMGESSITDIAYECGFNDLSYFIRVFKKYKKMTPGEYYKKQPAA